MNWLRLQILLGTLWAGALLAVGGLAAPSLFAVLDRQAAGTGAGQIFAVEARLSLGMAILLFALERRRLRDAIERLGRGSALSAQLLLVMGALFLTVFGHFAMHPMIQDAKAGLPTALSFGALHGISAGLYWFKTVLVLVLAWRLIGLRDAD